MCLFLTVNQTIIKAGSCRVYIQGISAWSFKDTSTLSSMLTSTAAHAGKTTTNTHLSTGLNFVLIKKSQILKKSNNVPQNNEAQSLFVRHFCNPYSLSPFRVSFQCSDSLTGNRAWGRPLLIGPHHSCSHVKCVI